jgi:hypothetical protein
MKTFAPRLLNSPYASTMTVALLLLLGGTEPAAAQEPATTHHPLVRIHSLFAAQATIVPEEELDLFVATDGFAQEVVSTQDPTARRWLSQADAAEGSARLLSRLTSALQENQVGLQEASCVAVVPGAPLTGGTIEFSWYGESSSFRRTLLTIYIGSGDPAGQIPSSTPPCSFEVCQILSAIAIYADAVLTPEVPLPQTCAPAS